MKQTNPLEQVTRLAAQALRNPPAAARSTLMATVGAAKNFTCASAALVAQLTTAAVRKVGIVPPATSAEPRSATPGGDNAPTPPEGTTPHDTRATPAAADRPVNVVEELGLDPAPVGDGGPQSVTGIDAAADREAVDVTPADVARTAGRHHAKE